MALEVRRDWDKGPYIQWHQGFGHVKRAWIQNRTGKEDWAGVSRYLNVARVDEQTNNTTIPVDFPIFSDLPDDEILLAFVTSANAATGCVPAPEPEPI